MIIKKKIYRSFTIMASITGMLLLMICSSCTAQPLQQKKGFTLQDTLRGTITPERAWWDVVYYQLSVTPDYNNKTLQGTNTIRFRVLKPGKKMQIDLQQPMQIKSISWNTKELKFERNGNVFYALFPEELKPSASQELTVNFFGKPKEAVNPPWDGGWIWKKDRSGRPWMSVACQGLGASVWYPCKDHQSDEPDNGASITITVPDTLIAVANGRLTNQAKNNGTASYTWTVKNPINNYNIVPYIGKYVEWKEEFNGEKGKLDCDYWVLDYNLDKAKEQFKQVPKMLKCFEHWFGPYPFYEDGYKLVESPHLGMEHQSAVAYGNRFQNGYLGRDLSASGWGEKWDFIIVHESGHEWFANNITSNDLADMWVHEGFTAYSETIYTNCEFGIEAGNAYLQGTRRLIQNDMPVIGPYGVNQEGSGDMYYKGSNTLHTIRQIIGDDEKFRQILRGLNSVYYHKTVNSSDVEQYISKQSGKDLSKVFDQYLRTIKVPTLEYEIKSNQLRYRWINCVKGFNMPLKIRSGDKDQLISPTEEWRTVSVTGTDIKADPNFYVEVKKI